MSAPETVTLHGVKLESRNLIQTHGLDKHLSQVLELLADFALQFKEVDRKMEEQGKQFTELGAQLRACKGEIERVAQKVDINDAAVRRDLAEVDERHKQSIAADRARIHALELAKSEVSGEIDAMKPRLDQLEGDAENTRATIAGHEDRMAAAEGGMEEVRSRVQAVEKTIKDVDLAGMSARLDDQERRCTKVETEFRNLAVFQDKTNKKLVWVEGTLIPEVRQEAQADRKKIRTETDEYVAKLTEHIRQRVTREEYNDEQNYFHSQMTQWVVEELETSRRKMTDKVNDLQTRMAQELEDLTNMTDVDTCVEKVQELSSAVGEMSSSLYDHKESIDRNADKLLELGANAAQVDDIRAGFEELKETTESALKHLQDKVRSKLEMGGGTEGNSAKTQALGALEGQISASLDKMKAQLTQEFAPRNAIEDTITVLKKRIVDLEWKMLKRRADDSGLDGRVDMYRQFNERLASMHHPILLTGKHPSTQAGPLPSRPRSALPAGRATPQMRPDSASIQQRPGSAQIRTVREEGDTEPGLPSIAVRCFESPEMRQAYREGRNVSFKGSSAASRIFRPRSLGDHILEVSWRAADSGTIVVLTVLLAGLTLYLRRFPRHCRR